MNNFFKFILFPLSILGLFSCVSNNRKDTVKILVQAPFEKASALKINVLNVFSFETSSIANEKLDSLGNGTLKFAITKPGFVSLEIGKTINTVYLEPGYDLKVQVKGDSINSIHYSGFGSEVNNYLTQISITQHEIELSGGGNISELDTDLFIARVDSLTKSLEYFHQLFVDSVQIPQNIISLLQKRNTIKVLALRQAYSWNYGSTHNFEIPQILDVNDEIPFDSTLLNSGMREYGLLLHMYMQLKFYNQPVVNTLQKKTPLLINNEIQKEEYPPFIKEFLRAKNIEHWLRNLGVVQETDSVFRGFKKDYPKSTYIGSLLKNYNEQRTVSFGKVAPNFAGIAIDGKDISLSDLKGKIVYVDVWATWCAPCREEIPAIKKLQREFETNNRVVFLFLSIDRDKEAWKKFISSDKDWKGIHINMSRERTDLFWSAYKLVGVPTYILIDEAGKIVDAKASKPSEGKIEDQIHNLLGKKI